MKELNVIEELGREISSQARSLMLLLAVGDKYKEHQDALFEASVFLHGILEEMKAMDASPKEVPPCCDTCRL